MKTKEKIRRLLFAIGLISIGISYLVFFPLGIAIAVGVIIILFLVH